MLSFETIVIFFALNASLCLTPCTEMIVVVTQSSQRGAVAGIVFVLGVCAALVGQVLLMAYGVSVLIQTSETLFVVLKVFGVIYLLYIAWQLYFHSSYDGQEKSQRANYRQLFVRGVLTNVTNPMNPLYLLLVLPSFVDASRGPILNQLLQLGLVLILAVLLMYSIMSLISQLSGRFILSSKKIQRFLSIGGSAAIVCFAIFLALAEQSLML